MHIVIAHKAKIPVLKYGGIERVIWYLAKELTQLGHQVTFLVNEGSHCDFANVIFWDETKNLSEQIPSNADIVHFHYVPSHPIELKVPYVLTFHENRNHQESFDKNTIFVSKNHAARYGSQSYVHNGLDWSDYNTPDFTSPKNYYHFLGNGAWRVKNLKGAIDVIKKTRKEKLYVLGGKRFNLNMGIRLTWTPRAKFFGMVGGDQKHQLLQNSKGLVFPVRWHEPFGLAITESLYYGCPVFGTPYGSLTEIVHNDVGYLSNDTNDLAKAIEENVYSRKKCHEYAHDLFNSKKMALSYLEKYQEVLSGKSLNTGKPKLLEIPPKFLKWK